VSIRSEKQSLMALHSEIILRGLRNYDGKVDTSSCIKSLKQILLVLPSKNSTFLMSNAQKIEIIFI
jgi:hypothetical protein